LFKFAARKTLGLTKDTTTEKKIKEAAKAVFYSKGFEGCSSREIAQAAGLNVALVNYYFRSKNKLFQEIFSEALDEFVGSMVQIFQTELSLIEKLTIFIEKEFDFLARHPELPNFIINETNRDENCAIDESKYFNKVQETGVFEQMKLAQSKGEMIEIDIASVILLILSNCQYPVMSKNFMQSIMPIPNEQYALLLQSHKAHVIEMLVNYLFKTKI
jgi:AcrR family transcriptional regulator